MTTIAYHQYTNIPYMSGSYASAPITQPIQHKYPGIVPNGDNGIQYGKHINPPKFGFADSTSDTAMGRNLYIRTNTIQHNMQTGTTNYVNNSATRQYVSGLQKSFLVSQSTKYIAPKDSSQYMSAKKAASIGQSGINNKKELLTYKSYDKSFLNTALRRSRSGGCVAPAKKGSIYNLYKTNTHWGGLPRNTY
jgi:hypothetical protein